MAKNLILTGIPRSGTTLLAAMVDGMPDAVALNEPFWQFEWMMQRRNSANREDFAKYVVEDFAATREKLLTGIPIAERRRKDGTAMTNYYRSTPETKKPDTDADTIQFTRPGLTPEFTLAIKHNGPYLSCLRQLAETGAFTVIAIVRDPVGVIASWNNTPVPQKQGKMPGAMLYWPEMRKLTEAPMGVLEKQVRMYDLICKRLYNLKDMVRLVTYEGLTDNPNLLGNIVGVDMSGFSDKITKRSTAFYEGTEAIAEAVKRYGEYIKYFYPG